MKQKESSKQDAQAVRRRYTWYFRPPFNKQFDRSHWWEGQSEIEPAAALYELARRHPLVRETWIKNFAAINHSRRDVAVWKMLSENWTQKIGQFPSGVARPHSLFWTCRFGLKSWAQLESIDRKNWQSSVGFLKGLDFRHEDLRCCSINQLAHWQIISERKEVLRKKGLIKDADHIKDYDEWEAADNKNLSALHDDLAANKPTAEEWERAISCRAIEAHRQGYLLLAVKPNLQTDEAATLMQKVFSSARRKYAIPKQRARWESWIPLIVNFENEELRSGRKIKKSQAFIQYRRALDGIRFENSPAQA